MARREQKSSKRQSIRDKARQAANQRERGTGGLDTLKDLPSDIEFFKPKKGKGTKGNNNFSIVPWVVSIENHPFQDVGDMWHECTYWQHTVGVGDDRKKFICLKKTDQSPHKKCPICDYREKLLKNGEDKELADSLKPKQRQIFNIIDHDDEDKGIQLFEMSPHQFGFLLDDEDRAQSGDFEDKFYGDPTDGLAIKARFGEGSFEGRKFAEISRIDFEERDDLSSDILEQAVDLDACLRILSPDELEKKFFEFEEGNEGEGESTEEEEKRETRKESRSNKTNKRNEKEPEPEPDEEDDPEEEPEPPVKEKKTQSKRNRKEPEPEPDEEDECPEGMEFGTDCDSDDKCDDCDKWDDCKDKYDEIESSKKSRKRNKKGEDVPF